MRELVKETTKTITREFNENGKLIKETEQTTEKEYKEELMKLDYTPNYPNWSSGGIMNCEVVNRNAKTIAIAETKIEG